MARATRTERRAHAARSGARPVRGKSAGGLPLHWLALGVLVAVAAIATVFSSTAGSKVGDPLAVLHTDDFHALAFSPDDPNVILFGHHDGLMRSDDGGRTWKVLVDRPNFDTMSLAANPSNPRQIFLAGHDVFHVSQDGGASWQAVEHNLPGTDIHGFAMNPDDPNRLCAFVNGHGVFTSSDGGRSWRRLSGQPPADLMALASAGGSPETIYAGSMSAGVLRTTDGGTTWTPSNAGLGGRNVLALSVGRTARQTVYAGTGAGLYRSDDAGASWRKLTFPGGNALAIAVSPNDPQVVLAVEGVRRGEGRLYRSADGGATWGGHG